MFLVPANLASPASAPRKSVAAPSAIPASFEMAYVLEHSFKRKRGQVHFSYTISSLLLTSCFFTADRGLPSSKPSCTRSCFRVHPHGTLTPTRRSRHSAARHPARQQSASVLCCRRGLYRLPTRPAGCSHALPMRHPRVCADD